MKISKSSKILKIVIFSKFSLTYLTSQDILKNRICLFSSYYIFHLFQTRYEERYIHLFQFIFSCLKESEQHRAVVIQSIETLNYIIIDNTDFERIKNQINNLMNSLKYLKIIETIQEYSFFDFLGNAIKYYIIIY